ncbi:Lysophospholipase [Mycena chlorophos]|uniref:Lysophospholipase n=1 Tax=Mycena chlorophos TaxID=658473 RepID=A0A8H6S2R8_MYCCL|nr:Lysophospholipase [Mycena chlorophos]
MKFLSALVIAASALVATAQVVPTFTAYASEDCSGTAVLTFSGVPEDGVCTTVSGSSVNVVVGSEKNCEYDFYSAEGCDPSSFLTSYTAASNVCQGSTTPFESVRVVCITTG